MNMKKDILLIGRTIPLNGGVNIHVYRLSESLKKDKIKYELLDYKNIADYLKIFFSYSIVGGAPAKVLKKRFSQEELSQHLKYLKNEKK